MKNNTSKRTNTPKRNSGLKTAQNSNIAITRVVERYNARIRKDINSWRNALMQAENIDFPRRVLLYNLYDDALMDNHLAGIIQAFKDKILNQRFKVVNKNTREEDMEKTRLLQRPWFYKYMDLDLDSDFAGHSLIQFGDIINGEFTGVILVPRRHVLPEFGVILVEQFDTTGIPYRDTPMMDWLIEVGEPKNLGLLAKAAPNYLWKKNTQVAWAEYCEIFGMPVRVGTTTTRNQADIDRMESMLKEMGKAAYGVFQEGEKIQYIESTKGDAFNVYDKLIDRANKEMSKLVLGSTMTTDDGASLSQSQVHERASQERIEARKRVLAHNINFLLIPFLNKHGYGLDEYEFVWDDREQLSLKEQWNIDQGLLNQFEIDEAYFVDKYNVPILGRRQAAPAPDPEADPEKGNDPKKKSP